MRVKVFLCCWLLLPWRLVNTQQQQEEEMPCISDATACTLQSLQANLRPETNPCEDFWTYACGNWQQAHASQTTFMDNFDIAVDKYAEQLRGVLQQPQLQSATPRLMGQLQTYYAACRQLPGHQLQMAQYMRTLPQELHALLADVMPAAADIADLDWLSAAAALRKFGLNGVYLDESVGVASDDAQRYAVQLNMPDEDVYFGSEAELRSYMRQFALFQGRTQAYARDVAAQLYAFERQLSALSRRHRGAAPLESVMQLSTLRQRIPQIDWQSYFSLLLERTAPPDLRLEVADLPYLQAVGALLQRTSRRVSRLYLLLRLCRFLHEIRPQPGEKPCIRHMGTVLPLGMNHIYERFVYGAQRSSDAPLLQTLLAQLKATFAGYLQANRLQLLPLELAYLRQKLQRLQLQVGNLPLHAELPWYDAHYADLNLSATDFYHNHWQALRFRTRLQHAQLLAQAGGRIDLATSYVNDDIHQLRTAPYFVHQRNMLLVPPLFMQLPFYARQQHPLLQHSLLGWILAHELSHAFESDGVIFDAAGNESPVGLAISERPSFIRAQACLNRSATNALRERVADVNGFQLAYDAYFSAASASSSPPVATVYSARQLFFLHFAQFFCGRLPAAIAHDDDDVRVAMVVAHMPEFAQDFNCTAQAAPVCQMWRAR